MFWIVQLIVYKCVPYSPRRYEGGAAPGLPSHDTFGEVSRTQIETLRMPPNIILKKRVFKQSLHEAVVWHEEVVYGSDV